MDLNFKGVDDLPSTKNFKRLKCLSFELAASYSMITLRRHILRNGSCRKWIYDMPFAESVR